MDVENVIASNKLIGHSSFIRSLAVLPDGSLASGSADSTIRNY